MALVPLVASAAVAAFIPARRILRTDLTLTMKASEQDA